MNYTYYQISKKSEYAIKALLELAVQSASKPVNVRTLAIAQDIPVRFLEIILNELKQGGFVRSIRGKSGGYILEYSAKKLHIGHILNFLEKLPGQAQPENKNGSVVLRDLLAEINKSVANVYEGMTLEALAEKESRNREHYIANYSI